MTNTDVAVLSDQSPQVNHMKVSRLEDSLFSKDLAPHYMQLAGQLAKSQMVPKAYQGKPQDLFIAMAMGYQIGLSVEQSIQAIAVINGKPCLWGDDALGLCIAHPDFLDISEEPIMNGNTITGYRCIVKRKNMSDHTYDFTLDMAKKAGLLSKTGPWTQYTERMLQLRARAFALRNRFPDALKGIKTREEVEDYIDVEYKVVDQPTSRTEQLKQDFLTKTGKLNEQITLTTSENITNNSNPIDTQETTQTNELQDMDDDREQEALLHQEITKLLAEKSFTDERIGKALAYYEVGSIEELSTDLARDFIEELKKR